MTEVVHPRDGDAVALRPCPHWCALSGHVDDDGPVYAGDGYHHDGPGRAVPASDPMDGHGPEVVVTTILKSWTCPQDAEPGPALTEFQPGTAEQGTGRYADLTPGQARAVTAALIELAGTAVSAGPHRREAR